MKFGIAVRRLSYALMLAAAGQAGAATLYVSPQGDDANTGSSSEPFRTITEAYSHADAGTTIIVMPGTYSDYTTGWGIHLDGKGTSSRPIVLRSQTPGAAVIEGSNRSDRNVGFYIDGNYNVVDGFEIKNCPKGGLTIWGNNNQIRRCNIHNNGNVGSSSDKGQDGIYSAPETRGNVYSANYIQSNGRSGSGLDHGLYLCGANELVINNVVQANAACGLQVAGYDTVRSLRVYNNVFAFNGTDGIILWQSLSGVDIKNNILYQNSRWGIGSWDAHGSGVSVKRNLSFGNGSGDFSLEDGDSDFSYRLSGTVKSDPLFVDSSWGSIDPHLRSGSPAIKAGVNLYGTFKTDMEGNPRQKSARAWDLGPCVY
jgi:hypothetical protein